jgi:hypothetical protein
MYKILTFLAGALIVLASCRHTDSPIAAPAQVCGCMDVLALNNNPEATVCDPTQCRYAIDSVVGVYDVVDTYTSYSSMGPVVTTSNIEITVTRESATTLLFDKVLACTKCANGGIPYVAQTHSFSYTNYIDVYTSSAGGGRFAGDTLRYTTQVTNSLSGFTPSRKGSGVRRK